MDDEISQRILNALKKAGEPLETREIVVAAKSTRSIVLYRLNDLRAEGKIKGKMISSGGKGVWIWWKP